MQSELKRVAVTGASGFIGSAVTRLLRSQGYEVVPIVRRPRRGARAIGLDDIAMLADAFAGCDAVIHLAGINREIGRQTYDRVHVRGTANVVAAAKVAGAGRVVMMSFLRARPDYGSAYHESKFAAEEIVRQSGLDFTVVRCGVTWGRGDHLLDHLSHSLHTVPLFATVGFRQPNLRPIAVADVARVLVSGLTDERLRNRTIAITGPEELTMRQVVERVGEAIGRKAVVFPMPVWFHRMLAWSAERAMRVPLISLAQVRMLDEGLCEPALACDKLPGDLLPTASFTVEGIRRHLPEPGPFGLRDLQCCCAT